MKEGGKGEREGRKEKKGKEGKKGIKAGESSPAHSLLDISWTR